MKRKYKQEVNKNSQSILQKSPSLTQLSSNFSRLYGSTKDYDGLRIRERDLETNRLRPLGFIHYTTPDTTPNGIMEELIKIHERSEFWCLASGGKDSISVAHFTETNYPEQFKGIMHIKTNIGVQKTTDWLVQYCEERGWKLEIREPDPPNAYDNAVIKYGFPGAGSHNVIMGILKYTTMRRFAFETAQRKNNHCLISGVRAFESVRRMGNYKGPIQRDGKLWFGAPFFTKTTEEVYEYLLKNGLKKTPVHDILGMSGECMCGAFASYGERERIKLLDPQLMAHIEYLEDQIQLHGTDDAKKRPKWGKANITPEESMKILEDLYSQGIVQKIKDLEEVVCGVECGPGTMRGTLNI